MKAVAYEAVYNQIVAAMEQGIIPWRKSWSRSMPRNAMTNRAYNGINFFLLSMTHHKDPRWLTYNQASKLNGQVRKGEEAMPVILWKWLKDDKDRVFPLLRYYNVFNIDQIDGIELPQTESELAPVINYDAEQVIAEYNGPKIELVGCRPCYSPTSDVVKIPSIELFDDSDEYYCTLFHELIHSTGHESRLKRDMKGNNSTEELIAELGAAFLCNACGINNTVKNSTAYIQSWLKEFKNDQKMLVHAAGKAQKAANFILGIKEHELAEKEDQS